VVRKIPGVQEGGGTRGSPARRKTRERRKSQPITRKIRIESEIGQDQNHRGPELASRQRKEEMKPKKTTKKTKTMKELSSKPTAERRCKRSTQAGKEGKAVNRWGKSGKGNVWGPENNKRYRKKEEIGTQ